MKTIDIKNIWATEYQKKIEYKDLQLADLAAFKKKKSNSIFKGLKSNLWLNYGLNITYSLAIIVLLIVTWGMINISLVLMVILLSSMLLVFYDIFMLKRINEIEFDEQTTIDKLIKLKYFFQVNFSVYRIVSALVSPILVILGMFYYKFYKYGTIEFVDMEDLIVFMIFVLLAYIIGIVGNVLGTKTIRIDMQDIINMEDESDAQVYSIIEENKKRKKLVLIFSLVAVTLGVLLFLIVLLNK